MLLIRWIWRRPDGKEYPTDVDDSGQCRLYDIEGRRNALKGTKDPILVHFSDIIDDLQNVPQEELDQYSIVFTATPNLLEMLREAKSVLSKPIECNEFEIQQQKVIDQLFSDLLILS